MRVCVRFFGNLRNYLKNGQEVVQVDFQHPVTVEELLQRLGVDEQEIWAVSVNDQKVASDFPLTEDCEIMVFPPIGGG